MKSLPQQSSFDDAEQQALRRHIARSSIWFWGIVYFLDAGWYWNIPNTFQKVFYTNVHSYIVHTIVWAAVGVAAYSLVTEQSNYWERSSKYLRTYCLSCAAFEWIRASSMNTFCFGLFTMHWYVFIFYAKRIFIISDGKRL